MALVSKFNFHVSLPVSFLKEGSYYIAYTPALDLSTSAKSFTKVRARFAEVVQIFFEELIEKGTLEEILAQQGWQKLEKQWVPPTLIAQETEEFAVPFTNQYAAHKPSPQKAI